MLTTTKIMKLLSYIFNEMALSVNFLISVLKQSVIGKMAGYANKSVD